MVSELLRDIDVALLRTFAAVVETGGMTSASKVQNLTQAAVSQQIKRLEELFGESLFDRSQKRLQLTSAGERLQAHALKMLRLNDEVWSAMTAPAFAGEVALGVPHDIILTYMPPILRSFSRAWPQIKVTLFSNTTPILLEQLNNGQIDLTLTTEPERGPDVLLTDCLVWAGMRGGHSAEKTPLPVALGCEKCAFRSAAVHALAKAGVDWELSCHTGSQEPVIAVLEADMAVAPFLSQTVPEQLAIIPDSAGLPHLPTFYVNLHFRPLGASDIALELGRHIRRGFAGRISAAA